MFQPLWSPAVLEEVSRHLPDSMSPGAGRYLLDQMRAAFPEASVERSGLVDVAVRLSVNEKDHHVVAAALIGAADVIVTDDTALSDELLRSGVCDVQRMLEFVAYAIDTDQPAARAALLEMAISRWGAAGLEDAQSRLISYFEHQGWDIDGLSAERRPRNPPVW